MEPTIDKTTPDPRYQLLPKSYKQFGAQIEKVVLDDSGSESADSDTGSGDVGTLERFGPLEMVTTPKPEIKFLINMIENLDDADGAKVKDNVEEKRVIITKKLKRRPLRIKAKKKYRKEPTNKQGGFINGHQSNRRQTIYRNDKLKYKDNIMSKQGWNIGPKNIEQVYSGGTRSLQNTNIMETKRKYIRKAKLKDPRSLKLDGNSGMWWSGQVPDGCRQEADEKIMCIGGADQPVRKWSYNWRDRQCYLFEYRCSPMTSNLFDTPRECFHSCLRI